MTAIHRRKSEHEYWNALLERHPERPGFIRDRIKRTASPDWRDFAFELSGHATRVGGGSEQRLLAVLASATAAFVHRCSEAVHFTIGVRVPRENDEHVSGNTVVPLGIAIADDESFKTLTYKVRAWLDDALSHASVPMGAWATMRSQTDGQLFDVAISMANGREDSGRDLAGASTNFLFLRDGDLLGCKLRYDANAFLAGGVALHARRFAVFLDRLCASPFDSISAIDLFLPGERECWERLNDTAARFPQDCTIDEIFREQAARTPQRVAVWFEDRHLTYSELDRQSNQIAHALRARGAGPEMVVAVTARRSLQTIPALLGVLKAGAAYLPIDPHEPAARQRFKLQHSDVRLVLDDLSGEPLHCDGLDRINLADPRLYQGPDQHLDTLTHPANLAYVLYTSGSTGKPKGVAVPHRGVVNRLHWGQQRYALTPNDVLLQKTSLLFDVSLYELFWWAWAGASVRMLPPDAERDPRVLAETLRSTGVTVVHFVPSMLPAYLDALRQAPTGLVPPQLRLVLTSGEALQQDQVREFLRLLRSAGNSAPIVNLYGPTEASIEVSSFECADEDVPDRIPIGRPISNVRLYVFDKNLTLCPPLIPGELYLGGECVTRGYVNDPASTAAAFVPNPLDGERVYRTGDQARLLPSGEIEFLGRRDHQLKIRGLRVETGEIEHRLREHPGIAAAVVCPEQRRGETILQAYVVTGGQPDLTEQTLRTWLANSLPDYMIPSSFSVLPTLPLLSSGKVDRKALAERAKPLSRAVSHVAPRDRTEAEVAAIWCRTLQVEQVGIDDPFFEIGGSSLSVLTILAGLIQTFGHDIPLAALFEHTTVRKQARWLDGEFAATEVLATIDSRADEAASIVTESLKAFEAGSDV
ncbi:amino acid adenylation domain-containing protein [Bradyrhizobium ontarionense]|uniref:Amino acid adenylation domain-containing protein n=1 Tax=Bradyrhizobium ontarionense TaxID=2898149 RepID=A0ABY3RAK4_9BRAD|nr:non-ribosomal peptide synthetase [Bradyrhizobium sp. A19]UFZ04088.1 amino acid adenylation domain-containing protein [Bradyrhizobium sp. A19]